ncbi:MAG TPA: carbohydrate kinase [Alphaproteobacteria bacterium]|nr:carbohydrate kinase [Alphaproteobacteria bacterium]
MPDRWAVVLDVGKTLAKLTLWDQAGALVERRTRPNESARAADYIALDTDGIEAWLAQTLSDFARMGPVGAIVPVGHGAAAAIIRDGKLVCPPVDYESSLGDRAVYERGRDPFAATGSPSLPNGLNLGAQLDWLESRDPMLLSDGATILPWPQYWAWRLSGVPAAEVSSLGCHTDLWLPGKAQPSALAYARGWADRLAPLRRAGEVLGPITSGWVRRTGLGADVQIYCGLHDSNAALLAARGFPEIANREATILSTGTWFVAMRSPDGMAALDFAALPEDRDCLVNVDVEGRPIPSARFMGGREIEILARTELGRSEGGLSSGPYREAKVAIEQGAMVLPTLAYGVGPFPRSRGKYEGPDGKGIIDAAASLYLALVADVSLELIGTRERILVEGRFASDAIFTGALARMRRNEAIYVSHAHNALPYGALRLIDSSLPQTAKLSTVAPLPWDLDEYKGRWRAASQKGSSRAARVRL